MYCVAFGICVLFTTLPFMKHVFRSVDSILSQKRSEQKKKACLLSTCVLSIPLIMCAFSTNIINCA